MSAFSPSLHRQAFPNSFARGPLSVAPKCHPQPQSWLLISARHPRSQPPDPSFPGENWPSPASGSSGGQFPGKGPRPGRSPQVSPALWSTSFTALLCLDSLIFLQSESALLSYFKSLVCFSKCDLRNRGGHGVVRIIWELESFEFRPYPVAKNLLKLATFKECFYWIL